MSNRETRYLRLDQLYRGIEELREVLNEICATVEDNEKYGKRLNVSECLDELIVEYMKELDKLNRLSKGV